MKTERIETVVIGGGQAGLTMSHSLSLCALPHIVLERQRVAERWRSERWDSLHFQFPNWAMRLPDWAYQGNAPDAFATRDEVVAFIEAYAQRIDAPLRTGVDVRALRRAPDWDGFVLDTGHSVIEAANVVIATGPYQQAVIPAAAQGIGAVFQIPASGYRRPGQLPAGGVLVVGAGASGCQIAEELLRDGRPVYLSVGPHGRTPRRYRGRDMIWWVAALGLDERTAQEISQPFRPSLLSGAYGGQTVDLRAFAAAGMVLIGHVLGARDGILSLATDLAACLAEGDERYEDFIRNADAHVAATGIALAPEQEAAPRYPEPTTAIEPVETLDLRAAGITSVIWATGYRYDFDWVDLDVFAPTVDSNQRRPEHVRGVTQQAGAYFLGLPLLHKMKSSFLSGVGDDATYLAEQILASGRCLG